VHVLFASHRYFPVPGGTERIAQWLAEGLVRQGHRATMITQEEPGTRARESLNGVDVIRLPMRRVSGVRIPRGYFGALRSTAADLFHLQGNRIWCADFYFPVARRFRWPQMVTGHGFYQYAIHPRPWDRFYFERYFPRALRPFDAYVCDTDFERQQLVHWGVPAAKLPLVPLGADITEFGSSPMPVSEVRAGWNFQAPLIAVYVGGFFENKRPDLLVEAAAAVGPKWGLVLIGRDIPGSPCNATMVRQLAKARGVEVRIPGVLPREQTIASMMAADAIVSASQYEGFGVTLAESMAAGRPFVAWSSGGAAEMAATGAGEVVRSVPEFAAALRRLEDPAQRAAMAACGRAAAAEWSMQRMRERYLTIYQQLVERALGR
jgi:glycosyltransferase involved in cell wall biosynthesis